MAFTLWSLLESALLVLNAICVLHEQRFLAKGAYGKFAATFSGCVVSHTTVLSAFIIKVHTHTCIVGVRTQKV